MLPPVTAAMKPSDGGVGGSDTVSVISDVVADAPRESVTVNVPFHTPETVGVPETMTLFPDKEAERPNIGKSKADLFVVVKPT
jgi:hypothetical protein